MNTEMKHLTAASWLVFLVMIFCALTIGELREQNDLLREQNTIYREGLRCKECPPAVEEVWCGKPIE